MRSNLKGIDAGFLHGQSTQRELLWRSLHEQLIRQSYIITLLYDVDRDQFGQGEKVAGQDEDDSKKDEP